MADDRHAIHRSDFEDDLELYALGLLSPDEEAEVERYLAEHPEARQRLAVLQETASAMALDLEPIEPPAGLRTSIVEQARAEGTEVTHEQPVSLEEDRKRRFYWPRWAALAAVMVAALAGMLAWNLNLRQSIDERVTIESYPIEVAQQDSELIGEIVVIEEQDIAFLRLEHLDEPSEQQVYQLWYFQGDQPLPAQTFLPDPAGNAAVPLEHDLSGYRAVAVTIEPEGGSQAPTSAPILQGALEFEGS